MVLKSCKNKNKDKLNHYSTCSTCIVQKMLLMAYADHLMVKNGRSLACHFAGEAGQNA